MAKDHGKNVGHVFCEYLAETKKALGKQYKGSVEKKQERVTLMLSPNLLR